MVEIRPPHSLSSTTEDTLLRLRGELTVWTLPDLPEGGARLDLSGLARLDTAGAWALAERQRAGAQLEGLSEPHAKLLEVVTAALPRPEPAPQGHAGWRVLLARLGAHMAFLAGQMMEMAEYLGRFLAGCWRAVRHPSDFRFTALIYHCQETGLRAVPIVALMAFLIGIVLAFQGAAQLKQFGAEIFVVNLIAISLLRELGILMTAIVVAGRTASALTASIGSMKMQEEIDAMRTLGLDPDMVLLVPRVLALVLMLPILGLVANVAGLVGGGLMSWVTLGISPSMFVARLVADTAPGHVVVGLSKAPVFAVIIGIIGVRAGMKVGKDAASLGAMTSSAVVEAIFAVIVLDALFSVFFAQVGI